MQQETAECWEYFCIEALILSTITKTTFLTFFDITYNYLYSSDPSKDVFIKLDGKKVAVPQGKPIKQPQYQDSGFYNSEYLIYKESQCRIRYLLELQF